MIEKTPGMALRIQPYSRTSRIVTWLTPEFGRTVTMAKGAFRPASPFLGQFDLFYTCEILFYARERNGVHILKECAPLKTRSALRDDWRASAVASYIGDLVIRSIPDAVAQKPLYDLAETCLDFLAEGGASLATLFWFELRFLNQAGLAPKLSACAMCGAAESGPSVFSCSGGGLLCRTCAKRRPPHSPKDIPVELSPDVLAVLRHWQNSPSPRAAKNTKCTRSQLLAFYKILGNFLEYYLETGASAPARRIAVELVAKEARGHERRALHRPTVNSA